MLRRNGPVVKSVESVLRLEGSLWGGRFVEEVGPVIPRRATGTRRVKALSAQDKKAWPPGIPVLKVKISPCQPSKFPKIPVVKTLDCGSTFNTTIYPKRYAQSKCV